MELNNGKFVTIIEYGDISSDGHDITDYFSIISNKEHTIVNKYLDNIISKYNLKQYFKDYEEDFITKEQYDSFYKKFNKKLFDIDYNYNIEEYYVYTDNYSKFILNLLNEEYPDLKAEFIKLPIIQKYIGYGLF